MRVMLLKEGWCTFREGSAAPEAQGDKADVPAEQKPGSPPSLQQAASTEAMHTSASAAALRTQSADGRRSLDSLTSTKSAAMPPLPQPYWSSPTSHEVHKQQQQQQQQQAARSASQGCASCYIIGCLKRL